MRFLPLLLLCLAALPAAAQMTPREERLMVLDSLYFTLDDGIMTPDEMALEAEYVHRKCEEHLYQRLYFDCSCIAGAFLRERERVGPLVMQDAILTDLFRSGGGRANCGNGPAIAGEVYGECMEYAASFRPFENNNEAYCQCTANRMARDFSSYPYLRTAYIDRLRVNAMLACTEQYPAVYNNY